jgi:hypothetical protein
MEFRTIQIGPFVISHIHGKLRFSMVRRSFVGGLAYMVPREGGLIEQYRLFIAGGPIASLVLCAVAYGLVVATHVEGKGTWAQEGASLAAMLLLVTSIAVLPGTLIPRVANGFFTDARLLWELSRKGEDRERIVAGMQLSREIMAGKRARDWSKTLIEKCLEERDGGHRQIRVLYLAYWHELDSGNIAAAREHLDHALTLVKHRDRRAGVAGQALLYEKAFILATEDRDAAAAEEVLNSVVEPSGFVESTRYRAEAAVEFAKGNRQQAELLAEKARAATDAGEKRMGNDKSAEREQIDRVLREPRSVSFA